MDGHIDDQPFPRFALVWAAALIGVAMACAATARLTDIGATRLALAAPVDVASLRFDDLSGGAIGVSDKSGRPIERYEPGQSGFVRVVLRAFAFSRTRAGIGPEVPFTLSKRADGAMVLEDPATGHLVTLDAFGHGNVSAFRSLLEKGKDVP